MPSLIPFFPRHRGKQLSDETKSNAEALLMEIATYGQETETLEDWLKKYEFKMVDDDDSGAFTFAYRNNQLTTEDISKLFYYFSIRNQELVPTEPDERQLKLSGDTALQLCVEIARNAQRTQEEFTVPVTPTALYSVLQKWEAEWG